MARLLEGRIESADSWQAPPPAPKPAPAVLLRSGQDSFAQMVDDAFEPDNTQPPSSLSDPQIGRAISQPTDWEGLPPSYQSLFPQPPRYTNMLPVGRMGDRRRSVSPRRATRKKRAECGVFFLLAITQITLVALLANAVNDLEAVYAPVPEVEFGVTVVLAAVIAEIVFIFTIAPCLSCIANGAGFVLSFSVLAAEILSTTGFLLYCVGLDMQRSTCDELTGWARRAACHRALEKAIAISVLRVLITAPACVSIIVAFVREHWWGRRWRGIPEPEPEIGTAL